MCLYLSFYFNYNKIYNLRILTQLSSGTVLVTPFRDATAMEAEPTQCKWYPRYLQEKDKMTCERYIHI